MIKNTGYIKYENLEEYNLQTGQPTGNIAQNTISNPRYIPPHLDLEACPVDPPIIEDISTIRVRAINQSSLFVNFDILQVRPDNSEVTYQGPFQKGPGQFDEGSPKKLLGAFLNVTAHLVAASNGLPVKLQLKWTDDTFLRESINVFPNQTWEIRGVPIPYEPLHKQEKVKVIVVDGYVPPTTTTTTTTSTTTTSTSSTTTTTTLKPINTLLIYIEDKSRIQVQQIRFYDSNHEVIFEHNVTLTEGTTPVTVPIGTYKIALKIYNSPSNGYISQLNTAETQQVIGDGVYAFEDVNLDSGAIISFKSGTSTNLRFFADFVAKGDLVEVVEPVLPNGMIKYQTREYAFELLLGGGPPTTPQTINRIYYRVDYIETGQTTYDQKIGSLIDDIRVVLETIQHRDVYDYNVDAVNPIVSTDYSYVLFPGFEYVLPYS